MTCTSLYGQVIGGLLVMYRPILESQSAEVCIDTMVVFSRLVA